jgi:hypothetical protein
MVIDWVIAEDIPPLHMGFSCLVCTAQHYLYIGEYHSDPEGWWDDCGQIYDVIAYIYLKDIPRPMRGIITNDKWIELL